MDIYKSLNLYSDVFLGLAFSVSWQKYLNKGNGYELKILPGTCPQQGLHTD